ncbi:hypothetical protein ACOAHJ_005088, partial [Escherichia coli]
MLPSEMMSWQPEFTDKTLSRKPGAVQPSYLHSPLSHHHSPQPEMVRKYITPELFFSAYNLSLLSVNAEQLIFRPRKMVKRQPEHHS